MSYGRVAFASFCAYALAHNLGFAAVSGAAVRYRLYAHWGLTPLQIGKTVAFCTLTFGLAVWSSAARSCCSNQRRSRSSAGICRRSCCAPSACCCGRSSYAIWLLSFVLGSVRLRGHRIELPKWRMAMLQVALATVDVAVTATIFFVLLPRAPGLTWTIFLGVYVASYTAGLAANLPGGIGVFDTAMLFGLESFVDAPHIVGAILVYRLYYYVIPLFLAGSLFAGNEVLLRGGGLLRAGTGRAAARPVTPWSEPDFTVAVATAVVALCGAMLLMLGVLAPSTDYSWLDPEFADIAIQAGQYIPSLIGAGLVIMALALSHRVTLAWGLTILLLLAGAGFATTQDNQTWVVAVLVLSAVMLMPFRSYFYRRASLLSGPFEAPTVISLIVLVICVLALALARHQTLLLSNNAWWAVVMSREIPNSVRFAVALAVVLGSIAIWLLVRPGRVHALPWDAVGRSAVVLDGCHPAGACRRHDHRRDRSRRPPIPPHRSRPARIGRSGRRRGRQDFRRLAVARPCPAGGVGPGILAGRAGVVEGVRRSGADAAAVGDRRPDRAGGRDARSAAPLFGLCGGAGPEGVDADAAGTGWVAGGVEGTAQVGFWGWLEFGLTRFGRGEKKPT